jgi:hypothetical protein
VGKPGCAEVRFSLIIAPFQICHSDRKDGAFCRPGVKESLFNFEFQDESEDSGQVAG